MSDKNIWTNLRNKKVSDTMINMLYELSTPKPDDLLRTIIHGELTNSKLWFKYNEFGDPCDMKILDWHGARYGSPAIDFSYILLNNLPDHLETASEFITERTALLNYYLNTLMDEFPHSLNLDILEQHFLRQLFYMYINLYLNHYDVTYDYLKVLKMFHEEDVY